MNRKLSLPCNILNPDSSIGYASPRGSAPLITAPDCTVSPERSGSVSNLDKPTRATPTMRTRITTRLPPVGLRPPRSIVIGLPYSPSALPRRRSRNPGGGAISNSAS